MREYSYIKRALLRELSENSRTPMITLAKKLRCSRNTVISNIKALEDELGMKYTIEFHRKPLGIVQNQTWTVTFGTKPSPKELKEIFKEDNSARFIAKTEGDFDLFINFIGTSDESYTYWALDTANKLLPYHPIIKPSSIALSHTGFFPIPTPIVEKIDFAGLELDPTDKKILLLLNENSRMSYSAIAKKLKANVETVRYRTRKIMKTNLIKRFTIILTKPPTAFNLVFCVNYQLAPGIVHRTEEAYRYYLTIDSKLPTINSFQLLALSSGSYVLFGIGCFEDEATAIRDVVIAHRNLYKEDNPEVTYAKITEVIKGNMPIRNIDIEKEYIPIKWRKEDRK